MIKSTCVCIPYTVPPFQVPFSPHGTFPRSAHYASPQRTTDWKRLMITFWTTALQLVTTGFFGLLPRSSGAFWVHLSETVFAVLQILSHDIDCLFHTWYVLWKHHQNMLRREKPKWGFKCATRPESIKFSFIFSNWQEVTKAVCTQFDLLNNYIINLSCSESLLYILMFYSRSHSPGTKLQWRRLVISIVVVVSWFSKKSALHNHLNVEGYYFFPSVSWLCCDLKQDSLTFEDREGVFIVSLLTSDFNVSLRSVGASQNKRLIPPVACCFH